MTRWGLSQSPGCSFCLNSESLFHIVTGCQQYLDCFTWRHNSILNFIANSFQPVINVHTLYADVNGFLNPAIITGENLLSRSSFPNNIIQFKCLYVLGLTVGFESNLNSNAVRKKEKIWTWSKKWVEKMCEIHKPIRELPWHFLLRMLHILGHDEWHWCWQLKCSNINIAINITSFVVEIRVGIAQT